MDGDITHGILIFIILMVITAHIGEAIMDITAIMVMTTIIIMVIITV
jgi:hypothetical protein